MSNELARRDMPAPVRFRHDVARVASTHYGEMSQSPEGQKIISRFGMAFASAARASKRPEDFYKANPASVAAAAALSLETGLLPGGALPSVWLIPRRGELQWMPTHRGLIELAQRAGYQIKAVPVCHADRIEITNGEIVNLETDPDSWADSLKDLRGVAVFVTSLQDGAPFASWWLPRKAIEKRARAQGAGPVWKSWAVEMALKTAIKYGFARGMVPVQSIELDAALTADNESEAPIKVEAVATPPAPSMVAVVAEPVDVDLDTEAALLASEEPPEALAERYAQATGKDPAGLSPVDLARGILEVEA